MQPPDSGGTLGQWLVGIVSTVAAALAGWAAASKGNRRDLEARMEVIERAHKSQAAHCTQQRDEILSSLRREVCDIIRSALKDQVIAHNKELAGLDKHMALQAQTMQQIQEDVEAIFGRLNRRDDGQHGARLTPHRRRKEDDE